MKLVTKKQINEIDRQAIEAYSIPSLLLMEHAAYSVFKYIKMAYKEPCRLVILCGPGNNGGDGLALARQLSLWSSHQIKVILLASYSKLGEDGKTYYKLIERMGICVKEEASIEEIKDSLEKSDIIVDALFGTGLTRPIEGDYYQIISYINVLNKQVMSIDIPSGIHADTGKILGVAVRASVTITFVLSKVGLHLYPGIDYTGKIIVADIGIPKEVMAACPSTIFAINKDIAKSYLPTRYTRSNKGTYGKLLVIGGQEGMSGAITLSTQSAIRAGAGTVSVAVPKSLCSILEIKSTESMTIPLPEENGHISKEAMPMIKELIPQYDVIAVGPGMGRYLEMSELIKIVLESKKPCVIDADGLYALKPHLDMLRQRKMPVVLTPHPGELAYLIEDKIEGILENPLKCIESFTKQYPVTLVLKMERTIIKNEKEIFINTTGNSGLAKGGSGDVLTGIITALIGQKVPPHEAARLGVYLHGRAADKLGKKMSAYTLLPSDIIGILGECFKELEESE